MRVKVWIEPAFFAGMDARAFEELPPELRQFAAGAEIQPFYQQVVWRVQSGICSHSQIP